ncbi:glycosyltransferase family 4 protein [Candidatus Parcubacteria bacterium]|nr:glycosyltransferase family 4 protein [Candidatus Parcubacteria bacterium]
MRIGIDARFYGEAGPGRYVANLLRHLEKIDRDNEYFIFLTKEGFGSYQPRNPRFQKVLADFRWYSPAEQFVYPWLLYRFQLDLVHFAQFNLPVLYFRPYVVTIHDMIMHQYPPRRGTLRHRFLFPLRFSIYKFVFKWAAQRARHILVPSEDACADLVELLQIPAGKITVTHEGVGLGVNSKVKAPPATPCKQGLHGGRGQNSKLSKYGISKPYLLFVGSMYPHKNLERLIEAFKIVRDEYGYRGQLVLAGKESFFSEKLRQGTKRQGLEDAVLFPAARVGRYLTDQEMALFYSQAELFVFPSLKEGFGIPPLEAMAAGVPVAASSESCIPEVCGKAALYFDALDVKDIAEKIHEGLTDQKLREKLIEAGFRNVKRFSWEKMARQTLKVYQGVVF